VDGECSSDRIQALLDSDQSQTSALTLRLRDADIKALTIIPNGATQSSVFSPDLNPNPGRLCVFRSVSERLLYDPIKGCFHRARQSPGESRFDLYKKVSAFRNAFGQEPDGGNPAQIIEYGRTELMRVPSQLLFNLIQ
jgi:hypothetical protein